MSFVRSRSVAKEGKKQARKFRGDENDLVQSRFDLMVYVIGGGGDSELI